MLKIDWKRQFEKMGYTVLKVSTAYKKTIYTLQVGDGYLHFDMTVVVDDLLNEVYGFHVSIVGQKVAGSQFIVKFRDKLKVDGFSLINKDAGNFGITLK